MANIRLAIDVNEKTIEHFAARDAATGQLIADAALDTLAKAVRDARVAGEALTALAEALATDATLSPQASALKLKGDITRVASNVASKLDKASADLEQEIANVRQVIHAPKAPLDQHMAGEVRGMFRSMNEAARRTALRKAMGDNNELFLASIFNAPAMLSGFSDTELEAHRGDWQRRAYPDQCARIERLSKAGAAGKRAGNSFLNFLKELLTSPTMALAEQSAKKTSKASDAINAAMGGA